MTDMYEDMIFVGVWMKKEYILSIEKIDTLDMSFIRG